MSRWITIVAVAVAVIAAVVYGFMPRPLPVDVVEVSRGTLKVTVEEEGKTRVIDRFVLSAPVAGFMRRVTIDAGDKVLRGQVVAELESLRSDLLDPRSRAAAQAVVSSARALLGAEEENARGARADAEYERKNLERNKKLFKDGFISRDALDQADTAAQRSNAALRSAEAAVRAARSDLEKARASLGYSAAEGAGRPGKTVVIKAPVSGSILKIHHESEGVVQAGEPLVDIGDPQKLEVRVEVLSTDAVKIKAGTPVLYTRWGGEGALSGTVKVVEPAGFTKVSSLGVEEQRVLVIADVAAADTKDLPLGDGFRVEASFTIWEGSKILQIPASALFRKGNGWAVFVIRNGKAVMRQVKVGHRTGLAAEILSGLAEGETVISHPDNSIEEGKRVSPRRAEATR